MLNSYKKFRTAVGYLESFQNITYRDKLESPQCGIDRTKFLLKLLNNPERKLRYVHITGTSGKGSVCSLIAKCIENNNKRVGLFTSPFAVSTVEKIQVNNRYISANEFINIVEKIKPVLDRMALTSPYGVATYFEICFVLSILYFVEKKCVFAVLEVGLGGTYDATNVIPAPEVSAITNIGYDHLNILGKTLEKIASDKGGIIKKGSNFFTTESNEKIIKILKNKCKKVGAHYNQVLQDTNNYKNSNENLARSICSILKLKDLSSLKQKTPLPCRFEVVRNKPLVILDGAHNKDKMATVIANLKCLTYKKLSVIIAISEDKDFKEIMKQIAPISDKIYITHFSFAGRKCVKLSDLYSQAKKYARKNTNIFIYTDQFKAYSKALKDSGPQDALLVTGSFFLAGDIRAIYYPEQKILENRRSFFN